MFCQADGVGKAAGGSPTRRLIQMIFSQPSSRGCCCCFVSLSDIDVRLPSFGCSLCRQAYGSCSLCSGRHPIARGQDGEQGNPGDQSSLLGAGSTRGRRPLTFPFVIGVVIHIATTPIVYFNVYLYLFFFFKFLSIFTSRTCSVTAEGAPPFGLNKAAVLPPGGSP